MIEGPRLKRIMALALPIIGGMVSQNVLNLVDTAMVGTLGDAALAAVGLGGFANFMCMALVLGVSTGVQATAARRKGEGRLDRTAVPLNAGLLLVAAIAPLLSIVLYMLVPAAYPYLNSDPAVIEQGVPYLQIRLLAMVFVGFNFAFRGYWNAVDLSKLYMSTLLVMHSANIFLNYVLIFGKLGAPAMGVAGAGLASSLSTVIGFAMYVYLGLRYATGAGFLHGLPARAEIVTLARLSLPTGIQQFFFAAGFTATYWIIGKVGTMELAAANVMINVMLVAILPGIAFGLASATLVGQALGKGHVDEAYRWGWEVTGIAVVTMTLLGVPMWVMPDLIMSGFIYNPDTLDVGRLPMRIVGLTMAVEALGLVLMNSLLGAGDAKRVMVVAIVMQWVFFLPLAYVVGPVLGLGLVGIWVLQGVYRTLQSLVFVVFWRRRAWAEIVV